MKKRRRARELVLQALYAEEISGNPIDIEINGIFKPEKEGKEVIDFASRLLKKTVDKKEALDKDIVSVVENWEFKRIALLDRLILRMALCELIHFDEIPPKVTINEAIDLAKDFSTQQSGRFVNGVLDALYRKFKSANRIVKQGRGLVE
jgi:N utilization substance protein B